jgi:hypothetical protein
MGNAMCHFKKKNYIRARSCRFYRVCIDTIALPIYPPSSVQTVPDKQPVGYLSQSCQQNN